MTEWEIMKALEDQEGLYLANGVFAYDAIALINRKNAENEELRSDNATLKQSNLNLQELRCNEKEKVNKAREKIIDIAKSLQTAKAEIEKANKEKENLTETYIQVCNYWQNTTVELQATRNEVMKMKVAIKSARVKAIKEVLEKVRCLFPKEDWFTREAIAKSQKKWGWSCESFLLLAYGRSHLPRFNLGSKKRPI